MTTRREFLKVSAAGGLAFGFHLPAANAQNVAPEINAWVVVRPDDTVIIRYARSEMGQGSMTSAAQLVAEELECDWSKVRVEYADTNAHVRRKRVWGDMAAVGSRTIRQSQDYLRKAGAGAREMLIAAAAQGWDVPAAECTASNGVITHGPSGRKTSFGKVAGEAAKLAPPKDVALKDPKDWKIAGKPIKRVDIPDIVTGRIRYGIDAQLPGMVYAAIAQCPVFGGKLKSADAAKIEGRRGVIKVLPMEDSVAVVADNWWRAKEALKELPIEWNFGGNESASSESILQFLRDGLDDASNVVVARREGELEQGLAGAAKVLEAEYFTPYLAHATLEPMGCTAVVKDGRVDVWTSTQNAEASHATAAASAGAPLENVYAQRNPHVPVGFWRTVGHSQNPFMRESFVDELARAAGKDPYEYRRGLLPAATKEYGVLEATAKAAGWAEPLPAGVHRGIAVTEGYGSYVAAVAELAVNDKNVVDIKRLVLGIDSGHVVNPDNVLAQMQGSAVFMLTAMFWGDITVKDGRVEQSNFHDYRMMRLREMPKVEVVLAPSGGLWGGIGEPGQAAIAPAVCNALFAATGKRVRSLPLKNHGFEIA